MTLALEFNILSIQSILSPKYFFGVLEYLTYNYVNHVYQEYFYSSIYIF